ncbi:MAG: hypothetical protein HOI95_04280, partial [Chromatiales bacterium]|nr:hypothetical protein [Chromatiales bacterium]
MSRHQVFRRGANLQRGSALIVSLSFLIVLTLLGVSSMGTSRLQLRMAINQQTAQKAFNACTSAIDMLLRTEDVYGQDIFKTSGVAQVFTYSASTATTETKFKKYSPRLSGNSIGKLGVYH